MTVFNTDNFVSIIMDTKENSKLFIEYEKTNKSNGKLKNNLIYCESLSRETFSL